MRDLSCFDPFSDSRRLNLVRNVKLSLSGD